MKYENCDGMQHNSHILNIDKHVKLNNTEIEFNVRAVDKIGVVYNTSLTKIFTRRKSKSLYYHGHRTFAANQKMELNI